MLHYLTLITLCLAKLGECQDGVPCSYPWHGINLKCADLSECQRDCTIICASSFGHFDQTRPQHYQYLCFNKYLQSEGYIDNGSCVCGVHFKTEGSFETCDLQPPESTSVTLETCNYYCQNKANAVVIDTQWQRQLVTCYQSSAAIHAVPLLGFCRRSNAPSTTNAEGDHICQCAFPGNWTAPGTREAHPRAEAQAMAEAQVEAQMEVQMEVQVEVPEQSMLVVSGDMVEEFLLRDDDSQFDGNHPELSTLYKSLEDVLVTSTPPAHIALPPSNQIAIMKVRDPEKFVRCDKRVWDSPDITLRNRASINQCNEVCTGWCHNYRSYYSARKNSHICYTHKRPSVGILNGQKCRCVPTYNYGSGKSSEYCAKANASDMRTVVGAPPGLICEDFCSRNVFTYVVDRPDYQRLIECVQRTVKQPDEVSRSLKGFCRGTKKNDRSRMVCQCGQINPPLYKEQLSDIQIPESEKIYPVMLGTYLSTKTKIRPLSIFMLEKYGTPDRIKEMLDQYNSSQLLKRTQSDFSIPLHRNSQSYKNQSGQALDQKGHRKHQSLPMKHPHQLSVSEKSDPTKIHRGKENVSSSSHQTRRHAGAPTSILRNLQSASYHLQPTASSLRAQPPHIDLTNAYVPDTSHMITSDAYPDMMMRNTSQNQRTLVNDDLLLNQFIYGYVTQIHQGSQNMSIDTAINSQNISTFQRHQYPIPSLPAQYYPQHQTNLQLLYQTNPQLSYQNNPQQYPNEPQLYQTNWQFSQPQMSTSLHQAPHSSRPQASRNSQMSNSVSKFSRSINTGEVSSRLQNIPKDKGKQPATFSSARSRGNTITAHFPILDTSTSLGKSRRERSSSDAAHPSKRPHVDVVSKLNNFGIKEPSNKFMERFFQLD